MTADSDAFVTGVKGVTGSWPALPNLWSYSSLREGEECPRRWSLARARYPVVWNRRGYPPRLIIPAVIGDIIHRSLDVILRTLYQRGCSSIGDPSATEALRSLGGYSGLIDREIQRQLQLLQANPRMAARAGSFGTTLRARTPDIRQRLQKMVARAKLVPTAPRAGASEGVPLGRVPLNDGSHPEVQLEADDLRFAGRADLITVMGDRCTIVDYKTGAPDDHHVEQLRMYQLLWSRDRLVNPRGISAGSLTLSYETHEVSVEPLDDRGLQAFADEVESRIRAVDDTLTLRPPPARPAVEVCRLCGVRHLCDDYWASADTRAEEGEFVDREGTIVSRNGARSWIIEVEHPQRERLLLRTGTEQPGFDAGDELRLLNARLERDEETERSVLTLTQFSEVFLLE